MDRTARERKARMGWRTLKRTATEFMEDNLMDWAAALTYYGLLSLFPALLALVAVVGLVADPAEVTRTLTDIADRIHVRQVGLQVLVDRNKAPRVGFNPDRLKVQIVGAGNAPDGN